LIISFHEGWSRDAGLETTFFVVAFLAVVDFLVVDFFIPLPDLTPLEDFGRVGDFFSPGAGEARGD
jgi:hypothetical protein